MSIIIGVIGMVLLLTAFALNLMRRITENSMLYIVMNILGAGLSVYYAWTLEAYPFIILEGVWAGFAVYKLVMIRAQVVKTGN